MTLLVFLSNDRWRPPMFAYELLDFHGGIALCRNVKNRKLRILIQLCSDGALNGIIYGDCLMLSYRFFQSEPVNGWVTPLRIH